MSIGYEDKLTVAAQSGIAACSSITTITPITNTSLYQLKLVLKLVKLQGYRGLFIDLLLYTADDLLTSADSAVGYVKLRDYVGWCRLESGLRYASFHAGN